MVLAHDTGVGGGRGTPGGRRGRVVEVVWRPAQGLLRTHVNVNWSLGTMSMGAKHTMSPWGDATNTQGAGATRMLGSLMPCHTKRLQTTGVTIELHAAAKVPRFCDHAVDPCEPAEKGCWHPP